MLEFSNTTTQIGLIQKCEIFTGLGKTGISGNSDLLKQFTGLLNDEYGDFVAEAIESDGRFQYDDSNHTKQPAATFSLVADQSEYLFTTDEQGNQILRLGYISVKDANGDWIDLVPFDRWKNGMGLAYDEFMSESGTPQAFDIQDGTGVKLFPAPNYSSSGGGKVYFQREPDYFASTDTTQKPGLPGPFHIGLAYGAASVWLASKNKAKSEFYDTKKERILEKLRNFYSTRNRFEQKKMRGRRRSSR
jgi:energy-coupling factor transporter ATP-binding protein EcfA2